MKPGRRRARSGWASGGGEGRVGEELPSQLFGGGLELFPQATDEEMEHFHGGDFRVRVACGQKFRLELMECPQNGPVRRAEYLVGRDGCNLTGNICMSCQARFQSNFR